MRILFQPLVCIKVSTICLSKNLGGWSSVDVVPELAAQILEKMGLISLKEIIMVGIMFLIHC